ncbi:amidase family protein [Reyranella sp. CPCC 100927]|uniref:amidase family protein n=1 Tax=Reyranella sp. CPCC 100927 TaxID=2599616 RepID=UPI0011B5890C|nr:amidase family protein [Reyranella sp. CPCC 100927]TWT11837.1 amidase [Reyranella sp. CPCC 100927]
MQNELWRWSAVELAAAIRTRTISSREATTAALARIAAVNPAINAVVDVIADEALAAADAADSRVKQGDATGPLHGVPVTIKVNIDQRGRATTNGVVAFRDLIAAEDSPVVANWRKAGAVIVGRTNTPAFSHRWFTSNALHGATRNPWNAALTPGGSSGGAAAAVASGMGAVAHGNDFGGSIRYPAYACGVAGLRPTPGRVPAFNPSATAERPITAQMMSVQGPLACRVADVRAGLAAMAMGDPRDGAWAPVPLEGPAPARPIRVALAPRPFDDVVPAVSDAIRQAGRWLADAGYAVEEVTPPHLQEAADLWHRLVINEERRFLLPAMREHGDEACQRCMDGHLDYAPEVDADGILQGLARRLSLVRAWQLFLEQHPIIILPVSHHLPFRDNLDQGSRDDVHRMMDAQRSLLAIPVLGFPAAVVPVGVVDGAPVGVQIVAGRFREDLCLDAAEIIEAHAGMPLPIDPRAP